ncbi:MAG: alanyl-tRNA editing protein [Vicinamibacteraceae bacterium]
MATSRLYYTDPARLAFEARVVRSEPAPPSHPGAFAVWLSESAFYPTTGGQPFDTGRLGEARVVDVLEDDTGEVVHVTDRPLEPGVSVAGVVDAARRLDHRQQHSGQHVLSAAFVRTANVATVSFHLGATVSTIDLAREVTPAEIAAAEAAANAVILEHRPVTIRFVSGEEAAALPLRKEPKRSGELRIIDIADWDISACGGTHVSHTGEIGPIAVRGWERFKGGTRLEFVCGGRTLTTFRELRDIVTASSRLLSVLPHELSPAIGRLQEEARDLRRSQRDLQTELAGFRAAALAASAETIGAHRAVLASIAGADGNALKALAVAIVAQPGLVAVLVGDARPAVAVVARGADVTLDAAAVFKALIGRFGGKGGGRPDLAQGGGLDASADAILDAARAALSAG